jgi:hypothetical protein
MDVYSTEQGIRLSFGKTAEFREGFQNPPSVRHWFGVTISFITSVQPSVSPSVCLPACMEQLRFHWTDFHVILYEDFSNICRENASVIKIGPE